MEMYAGRVACCTLVSRVEYFADRTDGRTDRDITLSARCSQHNNVFYHMNTVHWMMLVCVFVVDDTQSSVAGCTQVHRRMVWNSTWLLVLNAHCLASCMLSILPFLCICKNTCKIYERRLTNMRDDGQFLGLIVVKMQQQRIFMLQLYCLLT